jgi:hypothetical protein
MIKRVFLFILAFVLVTSQPFFAFATDASDQAGTQGAANDPHANVFDGIEAPAELQGGSPGVVWRSGGESVALFATRSAIQELTVAYLECDPAIMIVNEPSVWTIRTEGGSGGFEYKFALYLGDDADDGYPLVKETGFSSANTFTYTASKTGYCFVEVYIRDSQGQQLVWRSIRVQVAPAQDGNDTETVAGKVASLKAQCLAVASTPYARAKWMHDWLINNADYDHTYTHYKADGVLLRGTGVCDSYSSAYYLLMRALGIPCVRVANDIHAWNLIQLGGYWYHVDVTWDDSSPPGGLLQYTYFLRSDDFIRQQRDHATWSEGTGVVPACPYDWGQASEAPPPPLSDDLMLSLTLTPGGSVQAGTAITASWSVSGGTAPYTVKESGWNIYQDGTDIQTIAAEINGDTSTFTPRFGTSGRFYLLMSDATDALKYATADFTISSSPVPMTVTVTIDDSVAANTPITASWEIQGGVAPYTVDYCGFAIEGVKINYTNGIVSSETIYGLWEGETQPIGNSATFVPEFGNRGKFILRLSDKTGRILAFEEQFTITGTPEYKPLSVTVSLDPEGSVAVGNPITATWTISGSIAPYYIQDCGWFLYRDDDVIDSFNQEPSDNTSTFTPLEGNRGSLQLLVADALGFNKLLQVSFKITGDKGPLALKIELDKDSVDISKDESITATLNASGGFPPYSYSFTWYVTKDGVEQAVQDRDGIENFSSYMPAFGTSGRVVAVVEDSRGRKAFAEALFDITGSLDPMTLSVSLEKEARDEYAGERVTATLTADGGRPPYTYGFEWHELLDGQKMNDRYQMDVASNADTYRLSNTGEFGILRASVLDSVGNSTYLDKKFKISSGIPIIEQKGDATNDGNVDILDLVSIIDYIVKDTEPASLTNADANNDGAVDILDLVWVIDRIVGG